MIQKMDLSGRWEFCMDAEKNRIQEKFFLCEFQDEITLPGTTAEAKKGMRSNEQSVLHLTEYYHFEGYAWYGKQIELEKLQPGQRCWLKMERTRVSSVWLDGIFVGTQESMLSPHWYDLSDAVLVSTRKQNHRLIVMVCNVDYKAPGGHLTSPDTQTNWNGILGEISLYLYQTVRIADAQILTSAESRSIDIELTIENYGIAGEGKIFFDCSPSKKISTDLVNRLVAGEREIRLSKGENKILWHLNIPEEQEIVLWNEFTPFLYRANICVDAEGCVPEKLEKKIYSKDDITIMVGFRDLHTSEGSFWLNELPVFFRGKHDGMVFPTTGYAPMDVESWVQRFQVAKKYGINHYRFHTCCPPVAAFTAADKLGIYLEPEIPFWGTIAEPGESEYDAVKQNFLLEEGYRILKEYGNHPSFLMFSLGNELWGNVKELNRILGLYKSLDSRHWYTQGSNNFQFSPVILEKEDFFCGVRLSENRLFRGSYAMCDAPQGHVQLLEPENAYSYDGILQDEEVCQDIKAKTSNAALEDEIVEIQYQTGVKKVKILDKKERLDVQIPIVSHEIGQYEMYPDFREIERYTGVLGAEYLKIFRKRLEDAGMLHKAVDFFEASGALAVSCYKRELETAFRSKRLAGFQLLDLQDFPGQGIALVGILNAFMESKGLIKPEQWRSFCSDQVLMLQFPGYVYETEQIFSYQVLMYNGNPAPIDNAEVSVTMERYEVQSDSGREFCFINTEKGCWYMVLRQIIPVGQLSMTRFSCLYTGQMLFPQRKRPEKYRITVEINGTQIKNQYEIYVYPRLKKRKSDQVIITDSKEEMLHGLEQGKRVLYLGGRLRENRRIEGVYCTNFWNYPMFAAISENMGKKKPIGTMGLCIDQKHPVFNLFPTQGYTTPQWWKIVTQTQLAILDHMDIEPIVWMIDNFDRNHKIGLIFEAKVGEGSLLVCQKNLQCDINLEECWLYESLLSYAESDQFAPIWKLTMEQLNDMYD